ncbi:NAD(P)/FAD-dependent oxidoreductase [Pararhodobacter marinus]|uniref:NAD(P)/FAD-dependent oxidoreductase n=1 Tax=Pararhodobacter marinus TaxID=2184063 RepID=UPI003515382D
MRVAVIGAGILGASVGLYLREGGASVTLYDAGEGQATPGSFGWINASWGNDPAYRALRLASMDLWPALGAAFPGAGYRRCGGLLWDLPDADLRALEQETGDYGRIVDRAAAAAVEPGLRALPELAFHAPGEAQVEPQAAARLMAGAVERLRVEALEPGTGGVSLRTVDGTARFDAAVIAAGTASASLLEPLGLGLEMSAPVGHLAWSDPVAPVLRGLVMMPDMHLRQNAEGRIVLGEDFGGGDGSGDAEDTARDLLARAGERLGVTLALSRVTRAARPVPGDGRPALGALPLPGLYLALSHSGVTLAPLIGQALAAEILTGARDPLVARYAPDRVLYSA